MSEQTCWNQRTEREELPWLFKVWSVFYCWLLGCPLRPARREDGEGPAPVTETSFLLSANGKCTALAWRTRRPSGQQFIVFLSHLISAQVRLPSVLIWNAGTDRFLKQAWQFSRHGARTARPGRNEALVCIGIKVPMAQYQMYQVRKIRHRLLLFQHILNKTKAKCWGWSYSSFHVTLYLIECSMSY